MCCWLFFKVSLHVLDTRQVVLDLSLGRGGSAQTLKP